LETDRLLLREITESDAPAILALHGDAELTRWYGADPLPYLEAAHALIKTFASWRQLANPGVRWGIERIDQAGLIGTCGLFSWNRSWHKCVVGYELDKGMQGNGYMQEALQTCFAWGWSNMTLHRIEAQVHPQNAPSIALLEKFGFVREGLLREVGFWRGQFHDLFQYGLLLSEWNHDL
jgi:ribosomal-protein-alanine N-acetyltransferase